MACSQVFCSAALRETGVCFSVGPAARRGLGLRRGFAKTRFAIEKLVEIHPEAAVKFKDRQGAVAGFHFLPLAERRGASQNQGQRTAAVRIEGEASSYLERK